MRFKINFLLLLFVNQGFSQQQKSCLDSTSGLKNNLIFCLPFEGNANDETGNGYNGFVNGASLTTDKWGNANSAYSFNGTSDYINISKRLPDADSMTIAFWFRPIGSGPNPQYIFWEGDNECGNDLAIYYKDNILSVNASKKNSELNGSTTSLGLINLNTSIQGSWHCLVWTMTNTETNVYLDCQNIGTFNKAASNAGHHYDISFGCKWDGNHGNCGSIRHFFYKGDLDNFRIYNRTFTSSEVRSICCSNSESPTGLNFISKPILEISPNPIVEGEDASINVILNEGSNSKQTYIYVYDIAGKICMSEKVVSSNANFYLKTSSLTKGTYIIKLSSETNYNSTKKLIIL